MAATPPGLAQRSRQRRGARVRAQGKGHDRYAGDGTWAHLMGYRFTVRVPSILKLTGEEACALMTREADIDPDDS